jgi:hypothetical protein
MDSGKFRDFYRFRCKCGAEWIDVFGNIKARAHGACKACSEKGGSGARKDFIGRIYNDREIIKLIEWKEDSSHSLFEAKCVNGHTTVAILDDLKKHGCLSCLEEQREEQVQVRIGQTIGNKKIIRYLGRYLVGVHEKPRGFYRYQCLLCGTFHEATYSNIVVCQDMKCAKCPKEK